MIVMVDFTGLHREEGEDEDFVGRACYDFNTMLDDELDDTACFHCHKFMTLQCEHIQEFIEE